ncbi:unnamed protein product [Heterobilharzia americana]|nr:unnamed protein product [Heterobilharzia americana]
MATNEASVEALTKLLTEFHSPSTSLIRRQEIQNVLINFENSPDSWYHAMCYLTVAKSHQYVVLYCFGVIETTIVRQWPFLLKDHKIKIRSFLQAYLSESCLNESNFLLKKAAKLLSLIACFDWPNQYPDYMDFLKTHIFNDPVNNLFSIKTTLMGLYCLRCTYDSFLNPPDVIDYTRKIELKQLLCKETGALCGPLCSLMSRLCGNDGDKLLNSFQSYLLGEISHSSQNDQHSLWHPLFMLLESLASDCLINSGNKCNTLIECLECLCEMLRMFPGPPDFLREILVLICIFSLIGSPQCLSACAEAEEALALSSRDCGLLRLIGLTAFTCLQELIEKRNVDSFINHQSSLVFRFVSCHLDLASGRVLLEKISTSLLKKRQDNNDDPIGDISSALAMDRQKQSACDDYEMKLVEIIRCILPSCLKFIYINDNSGNFSKNYLITLLKAFCEFTFFTANLETYLSCINIWSSIFESLQFYASQRSELLSSSSAVHKILIEFGNGLFSRLFYSESSTYLNTLEYDVFENEMSFISSSKNESNLLGIAFPEEMCTNKSNNTQSNEPCEYVLFIRESLSTFNHLVNLLPHDFTTLLFQRFQYILNEYTSLVNATGLLSGAFSFPKGQPAHRIHWILRDFASIVQYQEYGQQIVHALLYSLRLNGAIFPFLHSINERLIRLSFVEVIVQTLLVWQALIVSGSIGFIVHCDSNLPFDKIYLPSANREHFYLELMEIFECFLSPLKESSSFSSSPLISPRIVYSCAQLFRCFFTSSFRDICPPMSTMLDKNSRTFTIFNGIFDSVCRQKCQTPIECKVLNPLISAFLCYLTSEDATISQFSNYGNVKDEENALISIRNSLLNRLILEFFLHNLHQNHFEVDQKHHITYLSLLNDAVLSLENSGNSARQLVYTMLTSSGLMDNLIGCLLNKILGDNPSCQSHLNSEMKVKFCTAYLIFLATFVRILSFSSGTLSSIPQLISQIIRSIHKSSLTGSNSFSITFIGPIIDILLLITHNKIFTSILHDTLELCLCVFLPILSTLPNAVFTDNEQDIHRLVCSACANNSQLMEQLFELIFKILSNNFSFFFVRNSADKKMNTITSNSTPTLITPIMQRYSLNCPDLFHRLMHVVSAVFNSEQVDCGLVRFVVEKLTYLNASHKLFDLYDFNKLWLSMFTSSILNLLINNKHDSCKDTLTDSLYYFALSFTHLSCPVNTVDVSYNSTGFNYFVQNFLPTYLNTIQSLDDSQRALILSCFYVTNHNGSYSKDNVKCELKDITVFNQCIELMIYNFHWLIAISESHFVLISEPLSLSIHGKTKHPGWSYSYSFSADILSN